MDKEQQRRNARRRRKRRRRMSYRQKIVYMQITLITVAIFLGLLVGAAALTKVMNNRQAQNSEKTASQEQQEETTEPKKDDSSTDNTDDTSKDSQEETTTPEPTAEPVSITVSMVGDCTLGTDVNFDQSTSFDAFYQMKNDPGYFFQNVKDIFTADDLTVANMEGTLTTSNDRQQKTLLSRVIRPIRRFLPRAAWKPQTLPITTVTITEIRAMRIRSSIWKLPASRHLAMTGQLSWM